MEWLDDTEFMDDDRCFVELGGLITRGLVDPESSVEFAVISWKYPVEDGDSAILLSST